MDLYELKDEIKNIKRHMEVANIGSTAYEDEQFIDWALKSILINELRTMNRSLEALHDINRKLRA